MPALPPYHIYVAAEFILAALTIAGIIITYENRERQRRRRK